VGGKTGVDTAAGKNLLGCFHQPQVVLADADLLQTLPDAHIRAGLAEAVKHGAIADPQYLDWIESAAGELLAGDPEALTRLIGRSVEIKAEVVNRDELEAGPRKMLNFGRTVGHAVEALSDYSLLHGEAIAIGMVLEAKLGEALGVTAPATALRLRDTVRSAGLPSEVPPHLDAGRILAATRSDKKAREGVVEYALIAEIGRAVAGVRAPDETVLQMLTQQADTQ
jgi:3-dehydroquinate synthetase